MPLRTGVGEAQPDFRLLMGEGQKLCTMIGGRGDGQITTEDGGDQKKLEKKSSSSISSSRVIYR